MYRVLVDGPVIYIVSDDSTLITHTHTAHMDYIAYKFNQSIRPASMEGSPSWNGRVTCQVAFTCGRKLYMCTHCLYRTIPWGLSLKKLYLGRLEYFFLKNCVLFREKVLFNIFLKFVSTANRDNTGRYGWRCGRASGFDRPWSGPIPWGQLLPLLLRRWGPTESFSLLFYSYRVLVRLDYVSSGPFNLLINPPLLVFGLVLWGAESDERLREPSFWVGWCGKKSFPFRGLFVPWWWEWRSRPRQVMGCPHHSSSSQTLLNSWLRLSNLERTNRDEARDLFFSSSLFPHFPNLDGWRVAALGCCCCCCFSSVLFLVSIRPSSLFWDAIPATRSIRGDYRGLDPQDE